jgi:hypothetical protein
MPQLRVADKRLSMCDADVLLCGRAAIVGRLGTAPLGAVGLSTLVFNFSNFLFSFLMTVTTPRVAVAAASGNKAEVLAWRLVHLIMHTNASTGYCNAALGPRDAWQRCCLDVHQWTITSAEAG